MNNDSDPEFYKHHAFRCSKDDFWGQVKRTVNGKPVTQDQIGMIRNAIISNLSLTPNDVVLDICCGNGALTNEYIDECNYVVGVDYSEVLINIAKENFHSKKTEYHVSDAIDFIKSYKKPELITKALCYGSLSYIEYERVIELLKLLFLNYKHLNKFYIGNLPDLNKCRSFFGEKYVDGIEKDHTSPIGYWWDPKDIEIITTDIGWKCSILFMPDKYYASHYRFDVLLEK